MTEILFIVGVMLGTVLGVLLMAIIVVAKQADQKKPARVVGTVSPELRYEWREHGNVEDSLRDDTCAELGLDPNGDYEIDLETGVVTKNDPSG